MSRRIEHRYQDPLELIWLACARALGIEVARSDSVYASYDGADTLTLSSAEHFDADDNLAQMILHELCHALVAGPRRMKRVDWGMENTDARDLEEEHACHRLQASLADAHGLRDFFAVTTEHRTYWDALPIDPLGPGDDPAIWRAREARERAAQSPFREALTRAFESTAQLARAMREAGVPADSLWLRTRALHRSGFPVGDLDTSCGQCGFAFRDGALLRCRKTRSWPHTRGARISASERACVRFEPLLDERACRSCGACCREAFDRVDVRARDLIKRAHPTLVSVDGYGAHLARPGGKCVALDKLRSDYACSVYSERPRACADFEVAGDACLTARRRVGLSS